MTTRREFLKQAMLAAGWTAVAPLIPQGMDHDQVEMEITGTDPNLENLASAEFIAIAEDRAGNFHLYGKGIQFFTKLTMSASGQQFVEVAGVGLRVERGREYVLKTEPLLLPRLDYEDMKLAQEKITRTLLVDLNDVHAISQANDPPLAEVSARAPQWEP